MRCVILRDDDTNALTPVECLEQLYRPFLDRGLPVNLATIPNVHTDTISTNGRLEQYLFARNSDTPRAVPLASNNALVRYLHENPGYHVLQHGCHHSLFEFDSDRRADIEHRLDRGAREINAAGFRKPRTFVAPYDRFSAASLCEAGKRYSVISAGWFELKRLPVSWWPGYALKKMLKRTHWKIGGTLLLTHPGCLLSYQRPYATMLESVKRFVEAQSLTVLVTHWWEYFREGRLDSAMLRVLHETAEWLAGAPDIRVLSFDDLADCMAGDGERRKRRSRRLAVRNNSGEKFEIVKSSCTLSRRW